MGKLGSAEEVRKVNLEGGYRLMESGMAPPVGMAQDCPVVRCVHLQSVIGSASKRPGAEADSHQHGIKPQDFAIGSATD